MYLHRNGAGYQIHQYTLTFTDVILVEQILRNFGSCFKVLEYRILHFPEVNRKTRNNISNKSWRILDMAWV